MADTPALPPSLAVTPNIPFDRQTLDQLVQERDYWQAIAKHQPGWGASTAAAIEYAAKIQSEIQRRQTP